MRDICNLYEIEKSRTTLYYPQGDRLVVRMNCTLFDMIALVATDAKDH